MNAKTWALALCLLAGAVWAEDVVVLDVSGDGVKVVQVDKTITVKIDVTVAEKFPFIVSAIPGPVGRTLYFWTVPAGVVGRDMGSGHYRVDQAPPGDMRVDLKMTVVDLDDKGVFKGFLESFGGKMVSVGGVQPPPPPPIPPVPTTSALWVIVIEESDPPFKNRANFLTDAALKARIKDKGHHWRLIDKDAKDKAGGSADFKSYVDRSAGKELPQCFVVDPAGSVRSEGKLPATPAELLALLQAKGG